MKRLWARIAVALVLLSVASPARSQEAATDPFLWLEDVHGARSMAWVHAENAKTLAVLQRDPRFATFYNDALSIAGDKDHLALPQFIHGAVYNFWQDADHVRGIWRTTTLAEYMKPHPKWRTVLDIDALGRLEKKNWVWEGADCDAPNNTRCLIRLSEGGEDAETIREFDLRTDAFIDGGFVLPRGKQSAVWATNDALLVAREWEPGQLTASGYPYVVKRLERGQPLSAAVEIYRGTKDDVSVQPEERRLRNGRVLLYIRRGVSFFESETRVFTPEGLRKLDLPAKNAIGQVLAGQVLVELQQAWDAGGASFPAGSLVAIDLAALLKAPDALNPTLVWAPGPRQSLDGYGCTRDRLFLTVSDNVKDREYVYAPAPGGEWTKRLLDLPDNSTLGFVGNREGTAAFAYVTGFLNPSSLVRIDEATGGLHMVKPGRAHFDASHDVVEQRFATSTDGTQIPYFVVRPKTMKFDGSNPTILYAYGGFGISEKPRYDGTLGKLWLERGGVYVLANIRGGGEFGPAWHEAGLKTHRQIIYDDFAAVAKDLIAKGVTSTRRLGIEGGSNGGLLMGVEMTQHPELWRAVDIEVPLLDMLRYEKIEAGASWVGEYGSVSVPAERAFLASISPYNNLKPGVKYPEPLIWTTTKDDRVGPEHARKFAAKLAAFGDPYLFYEVVEGGHAAGADFKEGSFTWALAYTYFTQKLFDPGP